MERVKLERKTTDSKKEVLRSHTKYLLVHDVLGVFIGFENGVFYWSNLDSGGNSNALLLSKDKLKDEFIKHMVLFLGKHFGDGFATKPCKVAGDENHLPMEECVKLGFNKWSEFENTYFTDRVH